MLSPGGNCKNVSEVRGGIRPAGSDTGFPSGCEDFPVSGWSNWWDDFTQWPQQSPASFVLLFTRDPNNIIDCKSRGHGMWPLVMYTAGIWGLGYITEFSPVMRVTALQNAHSRLTRGCPGLGLTRLPAAGRAERELF